VNNSPKKELGIKKSVTSVEILLISNSKLVKDLSNTTVSLFSKGINGATFCSYTFSVVTRAKVRR
jgi:hypothetical protein